MRTVKTSEGEYYHICNRGVNKQTIFHDRQDWQRFLFLIMHFQSPLTFPNISYDIASFNKALSSQTKEHSVSSSRQYQEKVAEIVSERTVTLVAFALMPNHFHLLLREESENGVSTYLQRTQNGQAKYLHTKYQTSGHVFQGPYRIVHIEDNNQLLHASAYIHRNCRELAGWKNREEKYPWSSFQDYSRENRFGDLLLPTPILEQFDNKEEYQQFIVTNSAKNFDDFETLEN